MALSNWDTFAMNHKGESCRGEFVSSLGIKVKAYKNWLFVEDNLGWRKGGSFAEPIIMQINNSNLIFKDVNVICEQQFFEDNDATTLFCIWDGYEHNDTLTGIVGICQFGDIYPSNIDDLHVFLNKEHGSGWYDIPETFKKLDLSVGKRYNQGDMFFHDKIGTDKQCTVPGEAKDTIFERFFVEMK